MEEIKDLSAGKKSRKLNFWQIAAVVLAILLLVFIFIKPSFTGFISGDLSKAEAADKAETFIKENLIKPGTTVELKSIEEESGLYMLELEVSANGIQQTINSYISKNGKIFFVSGLNIEEVEKLKDVNAETSCEDLPKLSKPQVELFVMSGCPYGIQAENLFDTVLDLFGNKIDFNLYFIAQETEGGFESLHGQNEVDEDIRQLCALDQNFEKGWDYIICRNKDITSSDWESCAKQAGLDINKMKTCSEGDQGKNLLKEDIKITEEQGISGSPTIFINGKSYSGSRSSDAFKEFICCGFKDEPSECSKSLSSSSGTTSGNC